MEFTWINDLRHGDVVWQLGDEKKGIPDRELVVQSFGRIYVTFSNSTKFVRSSGIISNNRPIFRTQEELKAAHLRVTRLEVVRDAFNQSKLNGAHGRVAELSDADVNLIYDLFSKVANK